jgi:putative ABC transport system permease protein
MTKPGRATFSKTAVVTLAIGIGAATAVVPVTAEERLAVLYGATLDGKFPNVPLTLAELTEFQRQSRALEQIAYHTFRGAFVETFRSTDRALQLRTSLVSGNWFDVLGANPALGRVFRIEDDTRGSAPVLVLSHQAWQKYFAGDSGVLGRQITIATNGRSLEIVGVMPPGLEYPRGTEAWTPLTAYSIANGSFELTSNELDMLGRLSPGATHEQARAELTAFFSRLPTGGFRTEARGVVHGLREIVLGDAKPAMRIVLLAAAMLLLIACVNVTNLLLIRSFDRSRELVVRAALGASRGRIVRHQLAETARLAVAAGIAGTIVAVVAVRLFVAFAPPSFPRLDTIVDRTALTVAVAVTILSLVIAGLGPAVFASRVNAGDALRSGTKQTMSKRFRLVGELLVATQVALAVVALSAAALVTRSFINLQRTDLAFRADLLVAADLVIPTDRLASKSRYLDLHERLAERLTSMPGVRDVTPVLSVPFIGSGGGIDGRVALPGQGTEERQRNPIVNMEIIAPSYLATIGTPVLQGRAFADTDRDGAPGVVIVSASTARALWPGQDPVGKRVEMGRNRQPTVVGVVPDTRYRDLRSARPSVYFPLAQSFFPVAPTKLLVRLEVTVSAASLIRQAVSDVDPGVTVASVATLEEHLEGPRAQPRLNSLILGAFAAAALTLAAIGLFSVMSTMVRRRSREIGIRMALGATSREVGTMVVVRGLLITVTGTLVGIVVARATGTLMSGLLYEIEASDILTTAAVALVVLIVAVVASVLPAKAGSRVEPLTALRAD